MNNQIGPFVLDKSKTTMKYGHYFKALLDVPFSKEKRYVRVWLPEDYGFDNPKKRYPVIYFSDGQNLVNKKLCAFGCWKLDIVAHEYGHAITQHQIDWPYSHRFLNEGMSDIWGAIMEYRLGPTGSSTWKIGDQLLDGETINCLRNIEDTDDSHAKTQIANAYQSTRYNNGSVYVKSGVFSHWFYLLVQGGSGYNESPMEV